MSLQSLNHRNNLRSKLLNNNGVLNIEVEALSRPLIADRDVVDISKHFTPSSNILLLTDVVHTVGDGERVVAADVVAGGINSLEISGDIMLQNYLLDDQGRGTLSESNNHEKKGKTVLYMRLERRKVP